MQVQFGCQAASSSSFEHAIQLPFIGASTLLKHEVKEGVLYISIPKK